MKAKFCFFLCLSVLLLFALSACGNQIKEKSDEIQVGMTYEEVVALLGEKGTEVGSGFTIFEWDCGNGEALHIWFHVDSNDALIVESFEIGEKLAN